VPIPTARPTGTKSWGLLGYLKDFISPPGYVARGPFGSRAAAAAPVPAASVKRYPSDAAFDRATGWQNWNQPEFRRPATITDAAFDRKYGWQNWNQPEFPRSGSKPTPPPAPILPPPASTLPAPTPVLSAGPGYQSPNVVVTGLTPGGQVDYSQGDEYKAQMAQYQNLIGQKKTQEAEDLGMKIWMEKYGGKLGLSGRNPLMEGFEGFVPTQGPTPAIPTADESLKDVKYFFPGAEPEQFNPLEAQEQQQAATAAQADQATTVKLPVRNRVQMFLQGGIQP